jgi:hypothetical protein
MSRHDHHECDHAVAYCKACDVVYCKSCSKEWTFREVFPWYQPYQWSYTTTPTITTLSTGTSTGATATSGYVNVGGHSEH